MRTSNIETGIMQGDPTPILISNSFAFGGDNFDVERAYKYMKKGALQLRLKSQKQEIRPMLVYVPCFFAVKNLVLWMILWVRNIIEDTR